MSNSPKKKSKTITVNSVAGFLKFIEKITTKHKNTAKESNFLFRGQESAEWPIETSASRRSKEKPESKAMSNEQELYYNIQLIKQFKNADFHSNYPSKIMEYDLGVLAQLQHNGAATSLIDFSANALVALWFACQESTEPDNNNGRVFILFTGDKSNFEEIDSIKQMEDYKVSIPEQLINHQVDGILNNPKFFYWKPAHLNNRITAQQSYFLIGKRKLPEMQKIDIEKDLKKKILQELSLVYGINEIMLFPDLVGFAQANSVTSSYYQEEQKETREFIYKDIIRPLDKSIKDNLKYVENYNKRGIAKYKSDDYDGAINDFTCVINIDPNNTGAYNIRGLTKMKLGNYKGAIDDYTKAISIEPNNADSYYNHGLAKNELGAAKQVLKDYHGAIGDYKEAINYYKAALKHSKDKNLTDLATKYHKLSKADLKELQDKLSKNKK